MRRNDWKEHLGKTKQNKNKNWHWLASLEGLEGTWGGKTIVNGQDFKDSYFFFGQENDGLTARYSRKSPENPCRHAEGVEVGS